MIDYELFDLFKQNSVDKQISIVSDDGVVNIDNTMIHEGKFSLTESLCSQSTITLGSCESSVLTFTYSTDSNISLVGKWITVKTVLDGNTDKPFKIGRYKIYSDVPTSDRKARTITAYDIMYDIINADVKEWYNGLFPSGATTTKTIKQLRESFFTYLGIEQVLGDSGGLPNDAITLTSSGSSVESLSGKTIASAICEINGCFGHITRDGKFKYVFLDRLAEGLYPDDALYPRNDLYPSDFTGETIDNSIYISIDYEDYKTTKIDGMEIKSDEDSVGVSVGGTNNVYKISNNPLVNFMSTSSQQTALTNLMPYMDRISYMPIKSSSLLGNPCFEVGDSIKFFTSKTVVQSYILQRTLDGIQSLRDSFVANGEKDLPTTSNSVYDTLQDVKGKTNVLQRTVDETYSEVFDPATGRSRITQTADKVSIVVDDNNKIKTASIVAGINDVSSTVEINADKINLNGYTITDSFECTNLKLSGGSVDIQTEVSSAQNCINLQREYGGVTYSSKMSDSYYVVSDSNGCKCELDDNGYFSFENSRHKVQSGPGANGLIITKTEELSKKAEYDYDSIGIVDGRNIIFSANSQGIQELGTFLSEKYAPISGSTNYSPISGNNNYVKATRPVVNQYISNSLSSYTALTITENKYGNNLVYANARGDNATTQSMNAMFLGVLGFDGNIRKIWSFGSEGMELTASGGTLTLTKTRLDWGAVLNVMILS